MANEKFLNNTGLAYYHDRAKTIFENKIERVLVNSTAVPIINKAAYINAAEMNIAGDYNEVGAKVTLTNEGEGSTNNTFTITKTTDGASIEAMHDDGMPDGFKVDVPSKDYVDNNGGKIDKIKVNGTEQTITNKEVDLKVAEISAEEMGDTGKADSITISNSDCGFAINKDLGVSLLGSGGHLDHHFYLADTDYVDARGSIAIDSANNNKTTFTVGSKTSSLSTSPDGVIYTEGVSDVLLPSKSYVDDAIAGVVGMEFVQVDTLPAEGEKGKIYLVPNGTAASNIKDEYIWIQDGPNGRFEKIGSTDIDLTDYWNNTNLTAITTAEIDALFA